MKINGKGKKMRDTNAKKIRREIKKEQTILVNSIVNRIVNKMNSNKPWWIPRFIFNKIIKGVMR